MEITSIITNADTYLACPKTRKQYQFPYQKIKTRPIDDEWYSNIADRWWRHDNIKRPLRYVADMLPVAVAVDDPAYAKDICRYQAAHAKLYALHRILLEIGGSETCLADIEEDIDKLLERGRYYPGRSKMMPGRPSQCHANSANLWLANRDARDIRICTGYALSGDGMWRQHTWLVDRYQTAAQHRTRIIETTTKRVAYFGFEFTDDEATEFAEDNF